MDGERLAPDEEKTVIERLLAYHPHSVDKIGCGLDSIMVRMNFLTLLPFVDLFSVCRFLPTID